MTLQQINIADLTVSPLNVRKYGAKDCADLVTSIRALGLLQPLLVRKAINGFEVIAGQRRLNACRIIAEDGDIAPLPCLVMAEGDDAKAIAASLAENIGRLPMNEVDQYKAFAKLIKEGRDPSDISTTFGITERMVSQRLALGRLYAPILTAYRKEDIHGRDIRSLTMATAKQQKAWWALVKDHDAYAPTGQRLREWLFGGANIPTANALFDVDASGLEIVSDLFGDEAYFTDADNFWAQQNTAIAAAVDGYNANGWADVVIMDIGAYFTKWDHIRTDIDDSGKVFVTCSNQGEVAFHEGYLSNAEARRRTTADSGAMPTPKPELTKAAQNYVDLHRHAAIRGDLLGQSGIALRLIAAHMIAGSSLWNVQADPQKAAKPEIAESLEVNTGQVTVQQERAKIVQMLGLESCDSILEHRNDYTPRPCVTEVFANAQTLNDEDMLRVLTFLMADSLSVQSPLLDILGQALQTDMQTHWIPDQTFFDLIRDKTVLNTMVGTLAGDTAAKQNVTATAKAQRAILTACLDGTRPSCIKTWIPPHMAFPARTYRQSETAEPQVVADPAEVSQAEAA